MSAQPGARESCSPWAQQASCAPASQRAHGASRRTLRVGLAAHYASTARICPVQLSTHVESWSYRASHADGRLLSRAQAAEAWFHEEYEPIADVLDELGIGGPRTEPTRFCARPDDVPSNPSTSRPRPRSQRRAAGRDRAGTARVGYGWHAVAEGNEDLQAPIASTDTFVSLGILVPPRNATRLAAQIIEPTANVPSGLERLRRLVDGFLSYVEVETFPGGCSFASVLAEVDVHPGGRARSFRRLSRREARAPRRCRAPSTGRRRNRSGGAQRPARLRDRGRPPPRHRAVRGHPHTAATATGTPSDRALTGSRRRALSECVMGRSGDPRGDWRHAVFAAPAQLSRP